MDTATDDRQALLDKPQPLGILPTYWFWKDPENWRLVGWAFAILATVTNIIVAIVAPPPLVGGAIVFAVMLLANGLLEKYVRHRAIKRRRELAASSSPALGEAAEHDEP